MYSISYSDTESKFHKIRYRNLRNEFKIKDFCSVMAMLFTESQFTERSIFWVFFKLLNLMIYQKYVLAIHKVYSNLIWLGHQSFRVLWESRCLQFLGLSHFFPWGPFLSLLVYLFFNEWSLSSIMPLSLFHFPSGRRVPVNREMGQRWIEYFLKCQASISWLQGREVHNWELGWKNFLSCTLLNLKTLNEITLLSNAVQ